MITTQSRPIRALWVMLSIWVSGRAATLWVGGEQGATSRLSLHYREPLPEADFEVHHAVAKVITIQPQLTRQMIHSVLLNTPRRYRLTAQAGPRNPSLGTIAAPAQAALRELPKALSPAVDAGEAPLASALPASIDAPPAAKSYDERPSFSASGWALVRDGGAPGLSSGGQLGGSQIGVRSNFALNSIRSISVTARLTAPLNSESGKEVAVGLALKPVAALPIQIIAERRIAADHGGRNDFELVAAGGAYDHPLGHHLTVSAYAQVGVVGITRRDVFADGSIEVEHPVVHEERLKLSVGAGAWGAAQPGVARLDAGPEFSARTPIGPASIKLTVSYRLHLAGDARPSSGPALSLGTDF